MMEKYRGYGYLLALISVSVVLAYNVCKLKNDRVANLNTLNRRVLVLLSYICMILVSVMVVFSAYAVLFIAVVILCLLGLDEKTINYLPWPILISLFFIMIIAIERASGIPHHARKKSYQILRKGVVAFVVSLIVLSVLSLLFYVFVGRIHTFTLPGEEVVVVQDLKASASSQAEEPGELASNIPVIIKVSLEKRFRGHWGAGSNAGIHVKDIYYYTHTDSFGRLRFPRTNHHVFIKADSGLYFTHETHCFLYDDGTNPEPLEQVSSMNFSKKSPSEFDEILASNTVKPLRKEDKLKMPGK